MGEGEGLRWACFSDSADSVKSPGMTVVTAAAQEREKLVLLL